MHAPEKMRALLILLPLISCELTGDKLARLASSYCSGVSVPPRLTLSESRSFHQLVGSRNHLQEAVFDPTCGDIWSCFKQHSDLIIPRIILAGGSIIAAAVTLFLWIWMGACVCCRCCRQSPIFCCCRERRYARDLPGKLRITLGALVLLCITGLVVDMIFAAKATETFMEGNSALICDAFTFTSESINGVSPATAGDRSHFLGLEKLSSAASSLADLINPDSRQMRMAARTVEGTVDIENGLSELSALLDLSQAVLGSDMTLINDVKIILQDSLSRQVEEIRSLVETSLTGEGLTETFQSALEAESAFAELSEKMETDFGKELIRHKSTIDLVLRVVYIAAIALIVIVLIPVLFLILSFVWGLKRLKFDQKPPRNPLLASCGWCWAILYAFVIFSVGGSLLVMGYFQASFCEMSRDSDLFIDSIRFRLPPSRLSDSTRTSLGLSEVLDACFKTTRDGNLLSGVFVGNHTTARSVLEKLYKLDDGINQVFSSPPLESGSLSSNRVLVELLDAIRANAAWKRDCNRISSSWDPITKKTRLFQVPGICDSQAEFSEYLAGYLAPGLETSAKNVDKATAAAFFAMKGKFENLIKTQILPPLTLILNGTDCSFMGNAWERIHAGFCNLQTVGTVEMGFTLSALGALAWIAVLVMFIIWRHLRDNRSLWEAKGLSPAIPLVNNHRSFHTD